MSLIFEGLQQLRMSPRDADLPLSEDDCVSFVIRLVPPAPGSDPNRHREAWRSGEAFSLAFHFQSDRRIEVLALEATLVAEEIE